MQEIDDENQSGLDQLKAYISSVHNAMGVITAKLVIERKIRLSGNLMFRSHETEFEEPENYLSQVDQLCRSPGRVLLQR